MIGHQLEEGLSYAKKNLLEESSHLWIDKIIIKKKLDLTNKRILDFGCGMGGMSVWYASNWNCKVKGIDIDSNHLIIANALKDEMKVNNITFEEKDVLQMDETESFDIIFLNDVIEHIPINLVDKILLKLSLMLAPKGIIYISYPPWQGPYASHINRVLKIPWCQFLPDFVIVNYLKRHNLKVVGKLESNLLQIYKGLNKMSHKKLRMALNKTSLKIAYRYSHSFLSKKKMESNFVTTFFPLNMLVTKEVIMVKNTKG